MTVDERITKYTQPEPNSGCWLWTGACGSSGYPQLTVKDGGADRPVSLRVHRFVCEQAHGEARGRSALHKCDVKLCVNPQHLYFGTQKENVQDAYARGRMPNKSGENSKLNKLTWADVAEIRASDASNSQLAARYGVARSRISDIRTLKSWRQHG
jgi:hypothetical protein